MNRASAPVLVCLGNVTIEKVMRPGQEVASVRIGGNTLYSVLAGHLWCERVEAVAPIGSDFPDEILGTIRDLGVSLDGFVERQEQSILCRVTVDEEGERTITQISTDHLFDLLSPTPEDIPPHYLGAEVFFVQGMTLEAQERLIPWLREHTEATIAFDLREDYVLGNERRLRELIEDVDIFMPSADEVIQLLGDEKPNWASAAAEFASWGPTLVVIKRGAEGSIVYSRAHENWFEIPAAPTVVVDTTGAGDAYCAGFLSAWADDPNLRLSACAGAVSASFAVAGQGLDGLLAATSTQAEERIREWADCGLGKED